jgi:hypothetical protein
MAKPSHVGQSVENFFINPPTLSTAVLVGLDGTVAPLAEDKKKKGGGLFSGFIDQGAVREQKLEIYDLA